MSQEATPETPPVDPAPTETSAETPPDAAEPVDGELTDKRMSLLEHLSELRVRLRNAAIAFMAAMIAAFFLVNQFFALLVRPVILGMKDAGIAVPALNVKSMTEGFWVMFKMSLVLGFLAAGPLIFWEVWKFVAPGLYKKEKKMVLLLTCATAGCFIGGAIFGWAVLARSATFYLTSLLTEFKIGDLLVNPAYMLEEVTDFLMLLLAGCGVSFELPVVLTALGAMGIVSAKKLWKFNRYALVLSVIVGAVLTPSPDPFNQLLLAGPLFVLYNISIILVFMIEKTRRQKEAALERGTESGDNP